MPPVAAAIAAITWADIALAVAGVAISFVGNYVIGALTQSLGGQNQSATGTKAQTQTVKQALVPWKAVYGRARVGGAWVYMHTTGNPTIGENSALMGVIVLACHQCDAIEKIYVGDDEVAFDASGNAMGKYANYLHVWKHLGEPDQVADPWLITWGDGTWTTNHRLRGRCYLAVDIAYNPDLFPSMPSISALVRGKLLYDPRDGGTRWSDNSALCVFDYLTDPDYGMGYGRAEMDTANWQAEANSCDETVATAPAAGGFVLPSDTFDATASRTYNYKQGPRGEDPGTRTVPGAFTIASDRLGLTDGTRVQLSGTLPPGFSAGTNYYVVRVPGQTWDYPYQYSNVYQTPVIQLATTPGGTPIAVTTPGSGHIYRMDSFWLTDVVTKGLATGDQVSVASTGALPAPLTTGRTYYWISKGQAERKDRNGPVYAYGEGAVADSAAHAAAGTAVTLTGIGSGSFTITRAFERRYTCNGMLDTSVKPSENVTAMLSSCGGSLVRTGQLWRLLSAIWRAPDATTLDEDDLRDALKVNTLVSRRELFNAVRGTYISPANFDQPSDFPPYPAPGGPHDVYLAEDGERIWSQDIQLPYTNSPSMAQRLAKILLMQIRRQITCVLACKLSPMGITVGDVVKVSNVRMGWTDATFEVVDWTFRLDKGTDGPVPGIDLSLRQTDSAIFDWDSGEETDPGWVARPPIGGGGDVDVPVILSAVTSVYETAPASGTKMQAVVSWQPSATGANPLAVFYTLHYRKVGDATWIELPRQTADQPPTVTILDLAPASYEVQARAVDGFGVASQWSAPPFPFSVTMGPMADLSHAEWTDHNVAIGII